MYDIYLKPTLHTAITTRQQLKIQRFHACIVINEKMLVIVNVKISYICQVKMFIETIFVIRSFVLNVCVLSNPLRNKSMHAWVAYSVSVSLLVAELRR